MITDPQQHAQPIPQSSSSSSASGPALTPREQDAIHMWTAECVRANALVATNRKLFGALAGVQEALSVPAPTMDDVRRALAAAAQGLALDTATTAGAL